MPDTSKLEKLNRELEKSEKKLRKRLAWKMFAICATFIAPVSVFMLRTA